MDLVEPPPEKPPIEIVDEIVGIPVNVEVAGANVVDIDGVGVELSRVDDANVASASSVSLDVESETIVITPSTSVGGVVDDLSKKRVFLEQLLDTKFLVTKQMMDFFFEPNVAELLVSCMTRVPHNIVFEADNGEPHLRFAPERPSEDTDALRRSYRLMEYFLQKSVHFEKFVESMFDKLVVWMCNIFHPSSTGSLYHWSKVFLALLQKNTSRLRLAMCSEPVILDRLLPYIHESAVGDAIVHFVGYVQFTQNDRTLVWDWLVKERVVQRLVDVALAPESAPGAREACDVVSRILDRTAPLPGSERLAASWTDPKLLERLVSIVCDAKTPQKCAEAAGELLLKFLVKAEERIVAEPRANVQQELPNNFAGVRKEELLNGLVPHVERLVEALLSTRNTSRKPSEKELKKGMDPSLVRDKLSYHRTVIVDIICSLCRARPATVLPHLGPAFWRTLLQWCEDHPESNIYHLTAGRLFLMLIKLGDDKTHRAVFPKCKILLRGVQVLQPVLKDESTNIPTHSSFFGMLFLFLSVFILESVKRGKESYLHALSTSDPYSSIIPLIRGHARFVGAPNNVSGVAVMPLVTGDFVGPVASSEAPSAGDLCYGWLLGYGKNGWEQQQVVAPAAVISPAAALAASDKAKAALKKEREAADAAAAELLREEAGGKKNKNKNKNKSKNKNKNKNKNKQGSAAPPDAKVTILN